MVHMSSQNTSKPPAVKPDLLPSAQSTDLKLVPANDIEYTQTAYLNEKEWRGPLTMEQYLQREDVLQATDLTKDGRITGWILTSDSLEKTSDGARPILASCESMPVQAYLARDGALTTVQGHGIASVYTRPEHRGKSYASRMMKELGQRLETWQAPADSPNPFSVLFSDIGQTFYARFGWKVFPSTHIHLDPINGTSYTTASPHLPAVRDLSVQDIKALLNVQYFEHRLRETSKAMPGVTVAAIRPTFEQLEWHFARDDVQTKIIGRDVSTIKGAILSETGLALIWHRVYAEKKSDWQLHILHAVIPPSISNTEVAQTAMAALLLRAQLEAHNLELSGGVEVWDPSELVIAAAQRLRSEEQGQVEIITRDKEHLCSLRLAPGLEEPVHWFGREKYVWC